MSPESYFKEAADFNGNGQCRHEKIIVERKMSTLMLKSKSVKARGVKT
jgi:hypothetical protein